MIVNLNHPIVKALAENLTLEHAHSITIDLPALQLGEITIKYRLLDDELTEAIALAINQESGE